MNFKKIIISAFVIFVPMWILAYIFAYNFFTSDFCNRTWPHDYNNKHCIHYGNKFFRILEQNPIISVYTHNRIMKNDVLHQKYVNQVYEILAFIDYVFTKYNMKYVLEFGTELGAIRHKGFIPWDDDIDIVLFENEEKVAQAFEKEIKANNQENRFVFIRGRDNKHLLTKYPIIRIKDGIVTDMFNKYIKCKFNNKEKYYLSSDGTCDKIIYKNFSFSYNEIFPLKKCVFGPLKLPCKNNVKEAFNFYYGDDWERILYTSNHTLNKKRNKKIVLTKELLKPALPTDDAWKYWVDKKKSLNIKK